MATVATQTITQAGLAPAYSPASAGGDSFTPSPSTFLHLKNASAAAVTATFVTPSTFSGLAIADLTVSVPAGADRLIGPMTAEMFRAADDGLADVTWSATASVTFAVLTI